MTRHFAWPPLLTYRKAFLQSLRSRGGLKGDISCRRFCKRIIMRRSYCRVAIETDKLRCHVNIASAELEGVVRAEHRHLRAELYRPAVRMMTYLL